MAYKRNTKFIKGIELAIYTHILLILVRTADHNLMFVLRLPRGFRIRNRALINSCKFVKPYGKFWNERLFEKLTPCQLC